MIEEAGRNPDWVLGFRDECWWSRPARPDGFAWATGGPLRRSPPGQAEGDGPAARACYGIDRRDTGGLMLRLAAGRPVSRATEDFLAWACGAFAAEGKKVFVLVWDTAAWHVGGRVRRWIEAPNRRVRPTERGCRVRVCGLPVKAPWLNPIGPPWMRGERATIEPDRKPTADEIKDRVFTECH